MDITESTLKKIKEAKDALRQGKAGREKEYAEVRSVAKRVVVQAFLQRFFAEKAKRAGTPIAKAFFSLPSCVLGSCANRWSLMLTLAEAIDRFSEAKPAQAASSTPQNQEVYSLELPEEDERFEEPAVAAFIQTEEVVSLDGNEDEEEDDDAEEDESFGGFDTSGLAFINVMEYPEEYQAMLVQAEAGEVRLIHRYRRSFTSRLVQSHGNAQEYYNALKNALLSYKGVKNRISWGYESFNKGRTKLAKINVKNRTVYLYLALDPAALTDTKYFFTDVSSKKKYEGVPVLFKIKGERKFSQALELVEKLCAEQMQLPPIKDFEADDYTVPYLETEELVKAGYIKQFTAALPIASLTESGEV